MKASSEGWGGTLFHKSHSDTQASSKMCIHHHLCLSLLCFQAVDGEREKENISLLVDSFLDQYMKGLFLFTFYWQQLGHPPVRRQGNVCVTKNKRETVYSTTSHKSQDWNNVGIHTGHEKRMDFILTDNRVMIIYDFHLIKITLAAAYRINWKSIINGSKRNA